jgi:ADP-heptose:LPS heptosyltransferase
MRTIFLIRKRAIGDVLWIEPVIRQLSLNYKNVNVHTKYNELFYNYPLPNVNFIDSLNLFHKIFLRIHRFFNWQFKYIDLDNAYEALPNMHILHAYQTKAHQSHTIEYPQIYLPTPNAGLIPEYEYIVLHLESHSTRNYRNVYGIDWDRVSDYFQKKGIRIIQIGIRPQNIRGTKFVQTSIIEMMQLINYSKFFIGIDSGPSHIAASLKKRSLIFFGAINPWYRHFETLFTGIIMQSSCEHLPCYHVANIVNGPICRLVGNEGIPKCSVHNTEKLLFNIQKLLVRDQENH